MPYNRHENPQVSKGRRQLKQLERKTLDRPNSKELYGEKPLLLLYTID